MDAVDALLAQARTQSPVPDGLTARVLADARAFQPAVAPRPKRMSLLGRLNDLIGGWQGMGGLAAATCAGFWIGFNPPAALPDAGSMLFGVESVQTLETATDGAVVLAYGWDLEEG